MALYFQTNNPSNLLSSFKKKIDEGHIVTWSCDSDGDFTHTTSQWNKKAWLRPQIQNGILAFYILKPKDVANIGKEIYAIYHGRFVESMLAHCDTLFSKAISSSLPEGEDKAIS